MNPLKRPLISAAILLILTCGARPAQAASIPFIKLNAFGLELCPQSLCGAAIFAGVLHGQVDFKPALGTFVVGITHTGLPTEEHPLTILTGGSFDFRFFLRRLRGSVVPGGFLFEFEPNRFIAVAELQPDGDNERPLDAMVLLDHTTFPPTVRASVVTQ